MVTVAALATSAPATQNCEGTPQVPFPSRAWVTSFGKPFSFEAWMFAPAATSASTIPSDPSCAFAILMLVVVFQPPLPPFAVGSQIGRSPEFGLVGACRAPSIPDSMSLSAAALIGVPPAGPFCQPPGYVGV